MDVACSPLDRPEEFEVHSVHYGLGMFKVPIQYSDLNPIGFGSVGSVCSAIDTVTGSNFAIKRVKDVFNNNGLAQRTYREIKMLRLLQHENLISLKDVFYSPHDDPRMPSDDVYIVTDLLQVDLHVLLNEKGPLEKKFIQSFMYQILRGLKYLHSTGIAHRDLKPSNILLNENCDLKICDFGMARQQDPQMTAYVSTRWYRAPEVVLTQGLYGVEVDMWSAGCVFAEMLEGKVLLKSKGGQHHLKLIMELLGDIPKELLTRITNENVLHFLDKLPKREPTFLRDQLKTGDDDALDLLEKMLEFNPRSRITASQALEFEYVSPYREVGTEVTAGWKFSDEHSAARADSEPWTELICAEIDEFRRKNNSRHIPKPVFKPRVSRRISRERRN